MEDNAIKSKYRYIKSLGHGGCGEVYLAESKTLGNLWAVKEIPKGKDTSISGYIEPEILKRLNHPALPRICDVYEDTEKIYIVEDYIEGTSLKEELGKHDGFDEGTVVDWAIQLSSVLNYLHCQEPNTIIYGDMKPDNIILTKDGFIKLVDFGVSMIVQGDSGRDPPQKKVFQKEVPQNDTVFIGTKGYAAPEQYTGSGMSPLSDIYSLGITLIQLLTGINPVEYTVTINSIKYPKTVSPVMVKILGRCIQADPRMRHQTARELMMELQKYSLHKDITSHDKTVSYRTTQNLSRIFAITGSRGTGISTVTAALAEYTAGKSVPVCIVDLSVSGRLEKGFLIHREKCSDPEKISSNLWYANLGSLIKDKSESMRITSALGQLTESFSYIFIDTDITQIKLIEQYMSHIFIVSDMNPYNLEDLTLALKSEDIIAGIGRKTSLIINKYYNGELKLKNILQSIISTDDMQEAFQELLTYTKVFSIPYSSKIYFKWIYSFFGDPLKFNGGKEFENAIRNIISNSFWPERRNSYFKSLLKLNSQEGNVN